MSKKNKSMRVKLITNPGAGKASESADSLKLAVSYLEKNNFKADVTFARPKEKATSIARQAVKDGYKIVIAMGGDGTIEAVMRGMVNGKARLGIIPAGMKNNIATTLGIPKGLQEACALIASDNTLKLDLGQVTTRKGRKFVFFEMSTIGLSPAGYPEANKATSGDSSKIRTAPTTFIHQETRPKVFLTIDDKSTIETETMLVMVSNAPIFGKNFLVAPDASMEDGLLDVSVYPGFGKLELLSYFSEVMSGGYSGTGKVQHYRARKIKVKSSPKLDVISDGVELGKGTVKIKIRKGALRVISSRQASELENSEKDGTNAAPVPMKDEASTYPIQAKTNALESTFLTMGKNHQDKSANLAEAK